MRAIRRFTEDQDKLLGLPPIGGEIVLTDLRLDGVSSKVMARLEDYARTPDAIAETQAEITLG
jgi:hypothetical protein